MPASTITVSPVQTPTITPTPDVAPWPQRYTDPIHVCPQQKRELTSPRCDAVAMDNIAPVIFGTREQLRGWQAFCLLCNWYDRHRVTEAVALRFLARHRRTRHGEAA